MPSVPIYTPDLFTLLASVASLKDLINLSSYMPLVPILNPPISPLVAFNLPVFVTLKGALDGLLLPV
jgi:hypothetical protein